MRVASDFVDGHSFQLKRRPFCSSNAWKFSAFQAPSIPLYSRVRAAKKVGGKSVDTERGIAQALYY